MTDAVSRLIGGRECKPALVKLVAAMKLRGESLPAPNITHETITVASGNAAVGDMDEGFGLVDEPDPGVWLTTGLLPHHPHPLFHLNPKSWWHR